ncbi:MAG: hypothetical protein RR893_10710 [Clostridia bacterium]
MRKVMALLLMLVLMTGSVALAAPVQTEKNYAPEAGTGWLTGKIGTHDLTFAYTDCVSGIGGEHTYTFDCEEGTLRIKFNKKLEVGVEMAENALKSAEFNSNMGDSRGYYAVSKSTKVDVNCKVLLEKKTEDGLYQGTFTVVIPSCDRTIGDTRPGSLESITLETGEFCFQE